MTSKQYSKFQLIRNSIFHLRSKNVCYNTRLSGNEGQCFLCEGYKVSVSYTRAIHVSLQCLSAIICSLKTVTLTQF